MTRDLLRTVINKQKLKANVGIQAQSQAKTDTKQKMTHTTGFSLDRRRTVSYSSGRPWGGKTNLNSANTTITSTGPHMVANHSQPTTIHQWKETGSFRWDKTQASANKTSTHTKAYPFSLLETIFSENSLKVENQQMAGTQNHTGRKEQLADQKLGSSRSLLEYRTLDMAERHHQTLLEPSAGRPTLRKAAYRRNHMSGEYRTVPNTFD